MAVWEPFLAAMARGGMTGQQALSSLIEQGFIVDSHRFWSTWRAELQTESFRDIVNNTPSGQPPPSNSYINYGWNMKANFEDVFEVEIYDRPKDETRTIHVTFSHDAVMSYDDIFADTGELVSGFAAKYEWTVLSMSWEAGRTMMGEPIP